MEEKKIWEKFLNKEVSIVKTFGGRQLYYRGIIQDVLDDKIIINDRKLGTIPLSFAGLSLLQVEVSHD